mmetsp:Transcript_14793/g.37961  ORF Transcript_14793/g.37961 Transcript_14793/m.37961 type:complete len:201 (+) Transcript_14793:1509-2111(+)
MDTSHNETSSIVDFALMMHRGVSALPVRYRVGIVDCRKVSAFTFGAGAGAASAATSEMLPRAEGLTRAPPASSGETNSENSPGRCPLLCRPSAFCRPRVSWLNISSAPSGDVAAAALRRRDLGDTLVLLISSGRGFPPARRSSAVCCTMPSRSRIVMIWGAWRSCSSPMTPTRGPMYGLWFTRSTLLSNAQGTPFFRPRM